MPATSTASGRDANAPRPGARLITSSTGLRAERPTYRIWFCSVTDITGWRTKVGGTWPVQMMAGSWRSHRSTTTIASARRTRSPPPELDALPQNGHQWQAHSHRLFGLVISALAECVLSKEATGA